MGCGYDTVKILTVDPQTSHPSLYTRARYGMYIVSWNSDLCSALATEVVLKNPNIFSGLTDFYWPFCT